MSQELNENMKTSLVGGGSETPLTNNTLFASPISLSFPNIDCITSCISVSLPHTGPSDGFDDALLFPIFHTLTIKIYLIGRCQHSRNMLSKLTFGIQTRVLLKIASMVVEAITTNCKWHRLCNSPRAIQRHTPKPQVTYIKSTTLDFARIGPRWPTPTLTLSMNRCK
jgi:hypothetical protein